MPHPFVHKPPRGWLHSDQDIAAGRVKYSVRYIGCLEVTTSMKSLDFTTRSLIAKECINRVCEAAGLKTVDKKRKVDKRLSKMLSEKPNMDYAGSNVTLSITSLFLDLTHMETGEVIAKHDMPNISFASGGDADTLDFVAYVAKDPQNGRSCYVLECGGGLAQTVITTVGQAFELRFKEYLRRAPRSIRSECPTPPSREDPDYYNDLPGKIAPDVVPVANGNSKQVSAETTENLIDLSTEAPLPPPPAPRQEPEYVNMLPSTKVVPSQPDPFDLQPLGVAEGLWTEPWFHGPLGRKESEALVVRDGDFLVRESQGQFVLTGVQGVLRKHLLLVDPTGLVRTKDRTFNSVSHLVNYHKENGIPIVSSESALVLRRPILRHAATTPCH